MPAPPGIAPAASARRNHVSEAETSVSHALPQSIRDRRDAALRLQPVRSGFGLSRHDLWLDPVEHGPSSFGLRQHELLAEIARCRNAGFTDEELRQLFVDPRTVPA